jgi:hypothetical protein
MMLHRVVLDQLVICFSCTASERLYILIFEVGRSGVLFQLLWVLPGISLNVYRMYIDSYCYRYFIYSKVEFSSTGNI